MSAEATELEKLVAAAIFADLKRQAARRGGYVSGLPKRHEPTSLDGEFFLMSAARRVLRELEATGRLGATKALDTNFCGSAN